MDRYLIQSNRVDFLLGGVDCLGEFGPAFYELISLGPGRSCIEGLGPQYRDWFVRRSSQCAFESAAALIGCPQFVVECGAVGADLTQFEVFRCRTRWSAPGFVLHRCVLGQLLLENR